MGAVCGEAAHAQDMERGGKADDRCAISAAGDFGQPGCAALWRQRQSGVHLPLYRQSGIYESKGIDLDRSTLADWVGKSAALLEPLADAIGHHVRAGQAIFADDTPLKFQAKGKCATARIWTYARDERPRSGGDPPAAWYRFSANRKGIHPTDHLRQFQGWIHVPYR